MWNFKVFGAQVLELAFSGLALLVETDNVVPKYHSFLGFWSRLQSNFALVNEAF